MGKNMKKCSKEMDSFIEKTAHAFCNIIEAEISSRINDMTDYDKTMKAVSNKLWVRFHGDLGGDYLHQWPAIQKAFEDIGADDPVFIQKFRKSLLCGECPAYQSKDYSACKECARD